MCRQQARKAGSVPDTSFNFIKQSRITGAFQGKFSGPYVTETRLSCKDSVHKNLTILRCWLLTEAIQVAVFSKVPQRPLPGRTCLDISRYQILLINKQNNVKFTPDLQ